MSRRRRATSPTRRPAPSTPAPQRAVPDPPPPADSATPQPPLSTRTRLYRLVPVALLLTISWSLAVQSLVQENPTVDEVVHLPAGISYLQTGSFRMYPHNPPLVKLLAAMAVLPAQPDTAPLYQRLSWRTANKAAFAHEFAALNAVRYFDLFTRARLVIPTFIVLGGLVVFGWSQRLYGYWGGLLSLFLWCFCPNILAHGRLVTTDLAATSVGVFATFVFWKFVQAPTWKRAILAGLLLGVAQITKFSLLLLYGVWPLIWLLHQKWPVLRNHPRQLTRPILQGLSIVALSLAVIAAGYGFQGLGQPLGAFDFTSQTLTRERVPPVPAPKIAGQASPPLREGMNQYRVNRFRGTWLGTVPAPLPADYLTGFDDQKTEAEGIPRRAILYADDPLARLPEFQEIVGYPVFLNGELRSKSWWYYYFATIAYKVPEGTMALVLFSLVLTVSARCARSSWSHELSLLLVPMIVLGVMSFGTNIALGLRYVLPILPYLFISSGKIARWITTLPRPALGLVPVSLACAATAAATAFIHPHYLAYFNQISGGPARGSKHLIDSNLDWGQDLVGLKRWLDQNAPGEPVGIAYFGQINPSIFNALPMPDGVDAPLGNPEFRSALPLNWFLPPPLPGTMPDFADLPVEPPPPGLYAVSASLMRGLPWRVYSADRWAPYEARRNERGQGAFQYFEKLVPFDTIGYSILLYRIEPDQARELARLWPPPQRSAATDSQAALEP